MLGHGLDVYAILIWCNRSQVLTRESTLKLKRERIQTLDSWLGC